MSIDAQILTQAAGLPAVDFAHLPVGSEVAALSPTVLFTTVTATLPAVREAARLAHDFGTHVRVLVPSVVPYPLDLERPPVDPLFRLRRFRAFCNEHSAETFIDVRLCRNRRYCIHDALLPHSLVLIGARASFWPLAYEKLLARDMQRHGHAVILVASTGHLKRMVTLLRPFERSAFRIEHDDFADVQAFYARLNLR